MDDLEQYRQPWESDEHWVFRREFIKTHKERFPNEDRLLCLAQVFANVELLGCSYPEPVMEQIKELSREIPQVQKLRDKRKERTVVKFVKCTSEGASRYAGNKRSSNSEVSNATAEAKKPQRDYPSVGSINRIAASQLFDSRPSKEEPVASYFTVKGAKHQGEKPLSPLISYKTVKYDNSKESGLKRMGERVSHKPMIVDYQGKFVKEGQKSQNDKVEAKIHNKVAVTTSDSLSNNGLLEKIEKISRKLVAYLIRGKDCPSNNQIGSLNRACRNSGRVKMTSLIEHRKSVCQKGCKFKGFYCSLIISDVIVGIGINAIKKDARNMAYENGIQQLFETEKKLVKLDPKWWKSDTDPKWKLTTAKNVYGNAEICQCLLEKLENADDATLDLEVDDKVRIKAKKFFKPTLKVEDKTPVTDDHPLVSKFRVLSVAKQELESDSVDNTDELRFLDILCAKCRVKRYYKYEQLPRNSRKFKFMTNLRISNVLIGKGPGTSKREARLNACKRALMLLSQNEFKVVPTNPDALESNDFKLIARDVIDFTVEKTLEPYQPDTLTQSAQKIKVQSSGNSLHQQATPKAKRNIRTTPRRSITPQAQNPAQMVIIDDSLVNPGSNCISMLINSCSFSKSAVTFEFEDVKINDQPMKRCSVIVNGKPEGEGVAETKQLSKTTACKDAINNLQRRIYTIQIKHNVSTSAAVINKEELISNEIGSKSSDKIDSTNKGFKMMQMMGWKGKGIGKCESGIENPVSVQDVYKREGLGFTNESAMNNDFKSKIKEILRQFSESNFSNDLIFSPDFTKEDRKFIHAIADKMNLKTVSKGGQGPNRYLVLSHKLKPQQLLHNLLTSGGSNEKYTLIPPTMMITD